MERNAIPSPPFESTNNLDINGVQFVSQDLRSYQEKDILGRYNNIRVERNCQDGRIDVKQGTSRQTEQMELGSKYRIGGGSCESIFSQSSSQSPSWTMLKLSKSQDAITSPPNYSQNQNWSDRENELESPEFIDDVVDDAITFRSSWQQWEEKTKDCPSNLSKASHSSQISNSNTKMLLSELLPEPTKAHDEGFHHFLQERQTHKKKQGLGFKWFVNSEEVDSDTSQVAESDGSKKLSVSLRKSILMERDFKIKDFNEEIRKVQSEKLHLLEERQHVSENDGLKRQVEAMTFDEDGKEQHLFFSFDPCSPLVLQKEISRLKSQMNDLQEANESAILELAKADEEISQQRKDFAKLKTEYTQKLQPICMRASNIQTSSKLSHSEIFKEGLQKEIAQLRRECRRLRTQSYQLSEENYRLKEDVWDLKMQHECSIEKHGLTPDSDWLEKDNITAPSNGNHLSHELHTEDKSLYRNDAFKVDGTFSKCKAALSSVNIKEPWESEHEERFTHNVSPFSMDSESTEVLILASEEGFCTPALTHIVGKEIHESSDDDLCSVNQNSNIALPISTQTTINVKTSRRPYLPVLPRRPFAPKSIADLNLGDLVKFSRPGGKISKGTIQYKGHLPGREDMYVGVELEGSELGKHDGIFQGTRYFLCKQNKGVLVSFSKVIMAWN